MIEKYYLNLSKNKYTKNHLLWPKSLARLTKPCIKAFHEV